MEADWAAEIGAGLPVIEADWAGFVDLRAEPGRIAAIGEATMEPALREALAALNDAGSPVFTSKCEVWELAAEEIDADEFGCGRGEACGAGRASWIDVIARDTAVFGSFEAHEAWVRRVVEWLRGEEASQGRVDLVVRAAVAEAREGLGITLYAAGCGPDTPAARAAWERVLRAVVAATMREARAPMAAVSRGAGE